MPLRPKHAPWIAALALLVLPGSAGAEDETVERLERLIREQQRLIEEQGRRLEQQDQRLEEQDQRLERLSERVRAMRRARRTVLASDDTPPAPVTSGSREVKLALSGQVHRAMNLLDDGDSTDLYHVDSDTSNTRVRFVGTGQVSEDLTLGTRLEVGLSPNNSGKVSQDDQSTDDVVDVRIADLFIASEDYGTLTIGKGWSASDGTAEVDLSGTDVVAYSGWSGLVDGIQLFDDDADDLSGVSISNAFGNRDGLGRENRISYETPRFLGFQLAAGANADERYDGAIRWSGQGHGFKAAGAGGIASFGSRDDPDYRLSGSVSTLHVATGLNLTLAAGMDERDDDSDASHLYAKLGLLRELFEVGPTAFGVDVTRTLNLPTGDDDGWALGGAVVQKFERWGAELWSQYRWIDVDRSGPFDFEPVNVGSAGVRVKF